MGERTGSDAGVSADEVLGQHEVASWEVFAQYIHRGQTVVVMGPGAGIAYDSSLLTAAHFLGKAGVLLIVDPKSVTQSVPLDYTVKGPIRGAGDVDLHLRQLTYLYDGGMDIALPKWVGPTATCASTTLSNEACEMIIDHNTSPFVTLSNNKSERLNWLNRTYQEYSRILRPGGILLLQTSDKRYKFGNHRGQISLIHLLEDSGFSVTTQRVVDKFRILLSADEAKLLRTVPIETEVFDKISHNIVEERPGEYYFEREARQSQFVVPHESVDMYVGIRQ